MSVSVEKLTKRFAPGRPPAIADIAFEAPNGAITSLIGPSGAGKSTVLRMVAGLEASGAGVVRLDGEGWLYLPGQEAR